MGRRCSECRKSFVAAPSARTTQRVCGTTCRARRDRKLARGRRRAELVDARVDERARQQRRRERRAAGKCHAPPSARKPSELQVEILQSVDRALTLSRATLAVELRELMKERDRSPGNRRHVSRGSLEMQAAEIA